MINVDINDKNKGISFKGTSKDLIVETCLIVKYLFDDLDVLNQQALTDCLIKAIYLGKHMDEED